MAIFTGFKPQAMQKIANRLGYTGAMENFDNYLEQNPEKKRQMIVYEDAAKQMARGGVVKMQEGGQATPRTLPIQDIPQYDPAGGQKVGDITAQQMQSPALPYGSTVVPVGTQQQQEQFIDPSTGLVQGVVSVPTTMATTTGVDAREETTANLMTPDQVTDSVETALTATQAAQTNPADPRAQVTAAQQIASSVRDLSAAQGNATLINNPTQREIQSGEHPPAWAAGAIRGVQSVMQQRGLGASSIAGQALVQAAMESALPIAQADAQIQAQFGTQNLSNRQQRAMLAAQQRAAFIGQEFDQEFQARVQNASRIADVANVNFTAEQQITLENSKLANTMNLNNLSNRQALVIAEASALANLDLSNLNNRQQSAVQNAQSFLQRDMANLSNTQQTNLFKSQQRIQSLLTDQAATNASRQFNATSQNQVDQFFANLATQIGQFNATQSNAQAQFNAGQANTVERFNAELNNQRDQFNAQNQLAIAQNNAVWRREIATADTVAVNRANEINANNLLDISKEQYYADTMEWAWTSAESELDRINKLATTNVQADAMMKSREMEADAKAASGLGGMVGTILTAGKDSLIGGWLCWVAREVYGADNIKWVKFKNWLDLDAPKWFVWLYKRYGERFALYIKDKPNLKKVIRYFMDMVTEKEKKIGLKNDNLYPIKS